LNHFILLKSDLRGRRVLVKFASEKTEPSTFKAAVPRGSVLGQMLFLLCTLDLPTSTEFTTATFIDDTAVLATDSDPGIASQKQQSNLEAIEK
jgi:hypothetical protein